MGLGVSEIGGKPRGKQPDLPGMWRMFDDCVDLCGLKPEDFQEFDRSQLLPFDVLDRLAEMFVRMEIERGHLPADIVNLDGTEFTDAYVFHCQQYSEVPRPRLDAILFLISNGARKKLRDASELH